MSSTIHIKQPKKAARGETKMVSGGFYQHKSTGALVFVASEEGPNKRLTLSSDGYNIPDYATPIVQIGGQDNGYSLRGLFLGEENYEEVDVEIVVKTK